MPSSMTGASTATNVWEARRKQLAEKEREREKDREREEDRDRRKASTSSSTSLSLGASAIVSHNNTDEGERVAPTSASTTKPAAAVSDNNAWLDRISMLNGGAKVSPSAGGEHQSQPSGQEDREGKELHNGVAERAANDANAETLLRDEVEPVVANGHAAEARFNQERTRRRSNASTASRKDRSSSIVSRGPSMGDTEDWPSPTAATIDSRSGVGTVSAGKEGRWQAVDLNCPQHHTQRAASCWWQVKESGEQQQWRWRRLPEKSTEAKRCKELAGRSASGPPADSSYSSIPAPMPASSKQDDQDRSTRVEKGSRKVASAEAEDEPSPPGSVSASLKDNDEHRGRRKDVGGEGSSEEAANSKLLSSFHALTVDGPGGEGRRSASMPKQRSSSVKGTTLGPRFNNLRASQRGDLSAGPMSPSGAATPLSDPPTVDLNRPAHLPPTPTGLEAQLAAAAASAATTAASSTWSGSPGPSSPYPYQRPPRLNQDGSFSPTRATDPLALSPSQEPWRPMPRRGRGRGRGRGGGHYAYADYHSRYGTSYEEQQQAWASAYGEYPTAYQGHPPFPMAADPALYRQQPMYGYPPAAPFPPPSPAQESTTPAEYASQTNKESEDGPTLRLLNQIEFYFSHRNLQGDFFLRQCMDREGWVPVSTVASFNRVRSLTTDLTLVLDTLMYSTVLAVDSEHRRVRKAVGWEPYVLAGAAEPVCSQPSQPHYHHHHHLQYAMHAPPTMLAPVFYPRGSLIANSDDPALSGERASSSSEHQGDHSREKTSSDNNAGVSSSSTATPATDVSRVGGSNYTGYSSPPSTISRSASQMDNEATTAPLPVAGGGKDDLAKNRDDHASNSTDDEGDVTLGVVAAEGLGGTLNSKGG
ncbi:hypothetical protein L7F22_068383 [Adiantum nelumboides]|nr:hypothetical protein [Adiantum nelumboides]